MIESKISSKVIIQQTISLFNLTGSSEADMVEWIGDCIEAIGYHTGFVNKWETMPVENYTICQPCDFQSLNYIVGHNQILKEGRIVNHAQRSQSSPILDEIQSLINGKKFVCESDDDEILCKRECLMEEFDEKIERRLSLIEPVYTGGSYWYEQGDSCWKTNIEDEVLIFYKAFPLDKYGYPMIVNEYNYKEAIKYYIMRCMMSTGIQHPVFKWEDVFKLSETYIAKARTQSVKFNRQQKQSFVRKWTGIPNHKYYEN